MNGFAVVVAVAAGIVGLIAVGNALSHRHTARDLAQAEWVGCGGVAGAVGRLVRVSGLAERAPGQPQAGPLSGIPAAWCSAKVTTQREHRDSDGDRHTETVTIAEMTTGPFVVRDGTGAVLVNAGDRLTWHDLPTSVSRRTSQLPAGLRAAEMETVNDQLEHLGLSEKWAGWGARLLTSSGGPYDLTEAVVAPGTPVVVLGTVETGPDGAVLGGDVLASTETVQEVAADHDSRERRSAIVAGIAFAVALAALVVGLLV
jgi:hypothetical protein